MRRWIDAAVVIIALFLLAPPARAQSIAVDAINASTPTRCAETDNVYVKLVSPEVRRFTVEATHPAYLRAMTADNVAPDFAGCDMAGDPVFHFKPRRVVLYTGPAWELRGFAYPTFWRSSRVPVRVGNRVETGLHLLQLWTRGKVRDEEVLVLYPADGYWRTRPPSPLRLGWKADPILPTAYGSSFLVGPIEGEKRPFVDIKDIVFDPASASFRLAFARGGTATVRVVKLSEQGIKLEASLNPALQSGPFAALRSMYVAADNADVAQLAWREPQASDRKQAPLPDFTRARVEELWAGRGALSHHNSSAPDFTFRDFRRAP